MNRVWYDHKTVLCESCHYYHGVQAPVYGEKTGEGCNLYGYMFHDKYPEKADGCEGMRTESQYRLSLAAKGTKKKGK